MEMMKYYGMASVCQDEAINMYLCMYLYMYVSMYVSMYLCIYLSISKCQVNSNSVHQIVRMKEHHLLGRL